MFQPRVFESDAVYPPETSPRVRELAARVPVYRCQLLRETAVLETDKKSITHPRAVADLVMDHFRWLDREHFCCLLLDTKNRPVGFTVVSIGSLNASIVHPREVYKPAILASAASLILIHNHPSGDPTPSQEDLEVTRRLGEAGQILGITVRDHIIIGNGCYLSYKEKGLL